MARPTKRDADKCGSIIRVRMTAADKAKILELAKGAELNTSDFLRKALLSVQPKRKKPSEERTAFIKGLGELGKIGSNINQISRAINRKYDENKNMYVAPELIEYALHGVRTLTTHLIGLLENNTDGHSRE